jgi:hypothetical protein
MHQKKDRPKCDESSRRIEINKSDGMKMISEHLGRVSNFR